MAALPYMQLYLAEYKPIQHGAYMLLLMNYWQRRKPLRNSTERLANAVKSV